MHFEFESTVRDSTKRIAEETRLGKMEAALELKITSIRSAYEKMDTLATSQNTEEMAKLSVLFELNKPTIAHDILEAKNMLLAVQHEMKNSGTQMLHRSITDYRFETNMVAEIEQELSVLENRLISSMPNPEAP